VAVVGRGLVRPPIVVGKLRVPTAGTFTRVGDIGYFSVVD
jgi:hypothetical protein